MGRRRARDCCLERHREATHGSASEDLQRALALAQQVDTQVDFLAWQLRPAALDDLGLAAALPRYLTEWSAHYGIKTNFQSMGKVPARLSPDAETAFYRVAQEALTNVVKHAHATRVDIVLEGLQDTLTLVIEDDGTDLPGRLIQDAQRLFAVFCLERRDADTIEPTRRQEAIRTVVIDHQHLEG